MINNVTLAGNLTRDLELRTTNSGFSIGSFSIAVNQWVKDGEDRVHYFDCKLLGSKAENLAPYLLKGSKVAVEGRLEQERWQDKEGNNKSRVSIVVSNLEFMSKRDDNYQPAAAPVAVAEPVAVADPYGEDIPF